MAIKLRDPNIEQCPLDQVIQTGEEIGLTNPGIVNPVTFHPVVTQCGDHSLAFKLPATLWDLVKIERGATVQMTKTGTDRMYYIEGRILDVSKNGDATVTVAHDNTMVSAQRRLFYRFRLKRPCHFANVRFPDGKEQSAIKAVVQDISPAGIGFKSRRKMPRDTRFDVGNLFYPAIPGLDGVAYYMQVMWVKGNGLWGYRHGAVFRFASDKDQDDFGRALSQLQLNRLSWYYHQVLPKPESDRHANG